MSQVILEGANKFQKDIRAAEDDLADMAGPMRATATTILGRAQSTVPRVTGALAASQRASAAPTVATVETRLVYAPVIHWGWPGHGIEANPWLTESARASENVWVREFEEHVEKAIDRMDKDYT